MRSAVKDVLPPKVRQTLAKLGADIRDARRKRQLTVEMMVERTGVSKATYLKIEKGSPSVSMGVYAMSLFVLGFPNALSDVADSRHDDTGTLLETARLPQRVRIKRKQGAL
jgi:transcriptional regulator with XRE-family HTH domain